MRIFSHYLQEELSNLSPAALGIDIRHAQMLSAEGDSSVGSLSTNYTAQSDSAIPDAHVSFDECPLLSGFRRIIWQKKCLLLTGMEWLIPLRFSCMYGLEGGCSNSNE